MLYIRSYDAGIKVKFVDSDKVQYVLGTRCLLTPFFCKCLRFCRYKQKFTGFLSGYLQHVTIYIFNVGSIAVKPSRFCKLILLTLFHCFFFSQNFNTYFFVGVVKELLNASST